MRSTTAASTIDSPNQPDKTDIVLRPAELAYLYREGDMSHTMLVLVVDLIQRLLKSRGDGHSPTLPAAGSAVAVSNAFSHSAICLCLATASS